MGKHAECMGQMIRGTDHVGDLSVNARIRLKGP
jgi:hypothetical protein